MKLRTGYFEFFLDDDARRDIFAMYGREVLDRTIEAGNRAAARATHEAQRQLKYERGMRECGKADE